MIRRPPRSTRTDTLFPYTTLFRSCILTLTIIHSSRTTDGFRPIRIVVDGGTLQARIEQLVSVSSTRYRASTSDLSTRSEEHTSELQSLMRISYAVFCLKKKHINLLNCRYCT